MLYTLFAMYLFCEACQKIIQSRTANAQPAVSLSRQHSSSNMLVSRSPQTLLIRGGDNMHANGDNTQSKINNQVIETLMAFNVDKVVERNSFLNFVI